MHNIWLHNYIIKIDCLEIIKNIDMYFLPPGDIFAPEI